MIIDDFVEIPEQYTILRKQIARLDKIIFEALNAALKEFKEKNRQYRVLQPYQKLKAPEWFYFVEIKSIISIDDESVTVLGIVLDSDEREEEDSETIPYKLIHDYYFNRNAFKEYFDTLYNDAIVKIQKDADARVDRVKEIELQELARLKKKYE